MNINEIIRDEVRSAVMEMKAETATSFLGQEDPSWAASTSLFPSPHGSSLSSSSTPLPSGRKTEFAVSGSAKRIKISKGYVQYLKINGSHRESGLVLFNGYTATLDAPKKDGDTLSVYFDTLTNKLDAPSWSNNMETEDKIYIPLAVILDGKPLACQPGRLILRMIKIWWTYLDNEQKPQVGRIWAPFFGLVHVKGKK